MPNLSILPEMPVVAVRTDDDLLGTVFVNMLFEKPLLEFGPAFIRTQHVHELTFILVFLRSRKKVLIIGLHHCHVASLLRNKGSKRSL